MKKCVLLLIALPSLVWANVEERDEYARCLASDAGQTTVGMVECSNAEASRLDKVLTENYREIMSITTPAHSKALRDAQRIWLKFRDAEVKASAALYEGGSLASVIAGSTYISVTKQRLIEINALLQELKER